MMASTSNTFKNSFVENFQEESSPPVHLLTLVSMLIDGPGVTNKTFSQTALTIAQLIQTNFRKNRDNKLNINRRIMQERETPAIIYSTLKRYGTIRSKTLINHFFSLG